LVLPIFPEGATHITPMLVVVAENGCVTYFHGTLPVFTHDVDDIHTFHMITSQFCCTGSAKQSDIVRAFGVTKISVSRAVKRYREKGPGGFYTPRVSRGPAVLTPTVMAEAQRLLDEGSSIPEAAETLEIKRNTLAKAVRAGRLHTAQRKDICLDEGKQAPSLGCKSERSVEDNAAPMGVGATNTLDRVAASAGLASSADIEFKIAMDVPNAGVLFALPALLACGLLRHVEKYFSLPNGYYQIQSIFLLLAFMALARFKTIESLRYCAPGEWGKLLGLDRIPEVRTLRGKLRLLTQSDSATRWSAELCNDWMAAAPEKATAFYIDGHVRVYHGEAKLPRHYVARQKLCLRATADYWVNAMGGQPFFVVHQDVDPGLVQVLENEIVPRLMREVPNQPTSEQLEENKLLHRFTVIFDREGYSPKLFKSLKDQRVACLSYNKHPGEDWPIEEFSPSLVTLASGERVNMRLAEREVLLGDIVRVREIRKLTESGHQTSILSTDYVSARGGVAAAMFARWCQENYFKYMRQEYNLDRIVTYGAEEIPESTRVVNPEYRRLDGGVRKATGRLVKIRAQLQGANLNEVTDPAKIAKFQQKQGELLEELARLEEIQADLKTKRQEQSKHIKAGDLPLEERIDRLATQSKHFIDTIKMTAYRAESAMVNILREVMSRPEDARALLRAIYSNDADLIPDEHAKTLTIRLHHLANRNSDAAISHLCDELNSTETVFPNTDLRVIYELVSSHNPRDQEV